MTTQDSIETLEARFRSGNSVPVERAHITADEWTELKQRIPGVEALREENERLKDTKTEAEILGLRFNEPDNFGRIIGFNDRAEKAEKRIVTLEAQLAQVKERESMLCNQLGKANAKLAALQAGGEAVAYINELGTLINKEHYDSLLGLSRYKWSPLYAKAPASVQPAIAGNEKFRVFLEDKDGQMLSKFRELASEKYADVTLDAYGHFQSLHAHHAWCGFVIALEFAYKEFYAPISAIPPGYAAVPHSTLNWWKELAAINPSDLVPRIEAMLDSAPAIQPQAAPILKRRESER